MVSLSPIPLYRPSPDLEVPTSEFKAMLLTQYQGHRTKIGGCWRSLEAATAVNPQWLHPAGWEAGRHVLDGGFLSPAEAPAFRKWSGSGQVPAVCRLACGGLKGCGS